MKIYRCIIGGLMVFFIIIGVWYIVSCYNEQRSMYDGTLIYYDFYEDKGEKVNAASVGIY